MKNGLKNPKLIMTNGILLIVRMFLVMIMGFYSTRLTLAILGDSDFGIYSIVGGVISMFAIITLPLVSTMQRFFNVEFAKSEKNASTVFSTTLVLILVVSLILLVAYEIIGAPCVAFLLNIPSERHVITNIIFQVCIIASLMMFATLPFSAFLYAKEKFGICASVELFFSFFKLVFLFVLPFIPWDYLFSYSLSFVIGYLLELLFFILYIRKKYPEVKFRLSYDKNLLKQMSRFSGLNLIESVAGIVLTYGTSLLINIFGSVLYNTAYGISRQLSNAINGFSVNVVKAIEPQVTSSHVRGDTNYRDGLLTIAIKATFLIIGFLTIVFTFESKHIFTFWLKETPQYSIEFSIITVFSCAFVAASLPIRSLILANGIIKRYFLWYGIISMFTMITMIILLMLKFPIVVCVLLFSFFSILSLGLALEELNRLTDYPVKSLLYAFARMIITLLIISFVYFITNNWFNITMINSICSFTISISMLFLLSMTLVFNKLEISKIKRVLIRQ